MKKEFGAEDYVECADSLLRSTRIVVSNLAFNAAGLNEGEEDLHREKLLKSISLLKMKVDGLLEALADEEEIERVNHALAEDSIEAILKSIRKEG
ncbi:hypothetical protein [Slackia isoflavoniconvertens]|uniref:hypothetical protein n=1 Tax=Slackia isoflavoniconvertens TaxID=572010 RepID=UPI003AB9BBC9